MATIPQQPPPDTAADLTALATWIDEQIGDETADRQSIAETATSRIRDITLQMTGAAELARRATAGRTGHGLAGSGMGSTIKQAFRDAICWVNQHPTLHSDDDPSDLHGQVNLYHRVAQELGILVGTGLDVPPAAAVLSADDLATVLGALDHAAEFLTERAAQYCEACAEQPAGACESHVDDLDQAGAYRAVAIRLGDDR